MIMHMGKTQMVVKPAMVVLLGAVFFGVVAVQLLHRTPTAKSPDFGYVNPDTWRFESRQGAQATVKGKLGRDFVVRVSKTGPSADCIYLRNAFNLDLNQERKPMRLLFEARAINPSGKNPAAPFPITFIVRDSQTLLWSDHVQAKASWQTFDRKIQLKKSSLLNVIATAHLGETTGAVEIKNLRVVDGD